MFSIWQEPWLLTDSGPTSPQALLAEPERYGDLQHGRSLEDAALLRLLTLFHACGGAEQLNLYGTRPFMQLPAELTESLPDTPIHALTLSEATGRDVTLLSQTFDQEPKPVSNGEAARILTMFHLFAPSRGLSRWNPTKDGPAARSVTFHAYGNTLADTLRLNTPDGLAQHTPFYAEHQDPQYWRSGAEQAVTLAHIHAFPWRSVTLLPEGGVRWCKQASGVVPITPEAAPYPDPHTLAYAIPGAEQKKRGLYDRERNPSTREVQGSLVRAMLAALNGDPLAPDSFKKATKHGADRARATGLITRSGQPVVLNIAEAELPWPKQAAEGREALHVALESYDITVELQVKSKKLRFTEVFESTLPGVYWQSLWPTLSGYLASDGTTFDELLMATHQATQQAAHTLS